MVNAPIEIPEDQPPETGVLHEQSVPRSSQKGGKPALITEEFTNPPAH